MSTMLPLANLATGAIIPKSYVAEVIGQAAYSSELLVPKQLEPKWRKYIDCDTRRDVTWRAETVWLRDETNPCHNEIGWKGFQSVCV